jgi:uncharacterized protein (DUF427 family)
MANCVTSLPLPNSTTLKKKEADMHPVPEHTLPGQESVWDYPRPAIAQHISQHLKIVHRGVTIAETRRGVRTLETSHPPSYYFPPEDVAMGYLTLAGNTSMCEWKGAARYYDVMVQGQALGTVAWSYPQPTPTFQMLAGFISFYAAPFDSCHVDGEKVVPQPGNFYGGWITSKQAGPFKGIPGSRFW